MTECLFSIEQHQCKYTHFIYHTIKKPQGIKPCGFQLFCFIIVFSYFIPVYFVPECFCVLRTSVLIFQVISMRSEEHTSELQSRFDLVCRLLLEKKKDSGESMSTRMNEGLAVS